MQLVLVDFDDTLVDTAPRFQRARGALFSLLAGEGFSPGEIHRVHHDEVDAGYLERMGYGPFRLAASFRDTYVELCRRNGRRALATVADACSALGAAVPGPPPVLGGALVALERLASGLPTALYTQSSDPDYQLHCIRASGVLEILRPERVHITPRKTAEAFLETMDRFAAREPRSVCMVGNSIRSDVNPALAVGARAIHVEQENPWIHDLVEPLSNDIPRVRSFREAVGLLMGD
jgi:putative hydrolase of the HAD superfamily